MSKKKFYKCKFYDIARAHNYKHHIAIYTFNGILTENQKNEIARGQFYRCANRPRSNLIGINEFPCPLWKVIDSEERGIKFQ